ncbi:MAG: hypothetical protein ACF8AM_07395 [Rhodopirellula sp. JB055]|uniref:hypothetical protein n=1 Tax=Rhodopirellula sp. JB055 TaxID=3342846 RepID=UPI00370C6FBF
MAKNKKARIPHKFLPWIAIRKQYSLTHAEVQMARELGLEPRRFPSYANIKDQPWKKPLKEFIAALYLKQTGREQPETVMSMEDLAAQHVARRLAKKQAKQERLAAEKFGVDEPESPNSEPETTTASASQPEPVAIADTPSEPVSVVVAAEAQAELAAAEPETEPVADVVAADPPALASENVVSEPTAKPEAAAKPVVQPQKSAEPPQAAKPPAPAEPAPAEEAPAAPLSPWEAARARLKAKSEAKPSDPDLTSDSSST